MAKPNDNPRGPLIGHYVPHPRVQEQGLLYNHITGEFTRPPSLTKQDFVDQCNINNILKAFKLTGQINHINARAAQGAFLDLPDDLDFQSSLAIVERAQSAFMALPAAIRDRFGSRPADFLEFASNPANADELIKLGIRNPPPAANTAPPGPGGAGGTPPAPTPAPAPVAAPGGSQTPSSGQAG